MINKGAELDFTDKLENYVRQKLIWRHLSKMSEAQKRHLRSLVKDGKATANQVDWLRYLDSLPPDSRLPKKTLEQDAAEKEALRRLIDGELRNDDGSVKKPTETDKNLYAYLNAFSLEKRNAQYKDKDGLPFPYKSKDYDESTGEYAKAEAEYPVEIDLSDDDWKTMYAYFRDNFRAMDRVRDNFTHKVFPKGYLDKWFGDTSKDGKPFWKSTPSYNSDAIASMKDIGRVLNTPEYNDKGELVDKVQMLINLSRNFQGEIELKDKNTFASNMENPDNAPPEFFTDVQKLFGRIQNNYQSDMTGKFADRIPPYFSSVLEIATDTIVDGAIEEEVSPAQVNLIKAFGPTLIEELYDKQQRQDAFTAGGEPGITNIIKNVKDRYDYDKDAFERIVPKDKDLRTNYAWAEKKWEDYREETWDKLGNRNRRHKYSSQAAKDLVAAIGKTKIKPTDGLGKILEEMEKTDGDLKKHFYTFNAGAIPQFNWIKEVLAKAKADMPKAFNGALRDGQQMRYLVEFIIKQATIDDKLPHAKTFLEMLTVMQYGPFTSNIRDKLFGKDVEWTFFSNLPSLKDNASLSFLAKITDGVIKLGARAAFELINYGWRKFQRRGLKFGSAGHQKFMAELDGWYEKTMLDPEMSVKSLETHIGTANVNLTSARDEKDALESERANLVNALGGTFDLTEYERRSAEFEDHKDKIRQYEKAIKTNRDNEKNYKDRLKEIGSRIGLSTVDPVAVDMRYIDLETEYLQLTRQRDQVGNNGGNLEFIENKIQECKEKMDECEEYHDLVQNKIPDSMSDRAMLHRRSNEFKVNPLYLSNKDYMAKPQLKDI
ncbi:MAG: hypothetical protein FWC83_01090, partial [Alphaproteobacteria bacterium]|nr:hypothetical protein [Alphaproteobacteria bacterium]